MREGEKTCTMTVVYWPYLVWLFFLRPQTVTPFAPPQLNFLRNLGLAGDPADHGLARAMFPGGFWGGEEQPTHRPVGIMKTRQLSDVTVIVHG